jgi:hypothetical protein
MEVVSFSLRQSLPSGTQSQVPCEGGCEPRNYFGRGNENRTPVVQYRANLRNALKLRPLNYSFITSKLSNWSVKLFAERLENIFSLFSVCSVESRVEQLCWCLFGRSCPITGQMALHHRDWRQTALEVMKNGGHVAHSVKQLSIYPQSLI